MSKEDSYPGSGATSQLLAKLKPLFSSHDSVKIYGVHGESWPNYLQAVLDQIPKGVLAAMKFLTCLSAVDETAVSS